MRRSFLKWLGAAALALTGQSRNSRALGQTSKEEPGAVAVYQISDLIEKQEKSGKAWLPFLKVESLYCGLYGLDAGSEDKQNPHDDDEVYYVQSGRGVIQVDGEDYPVEPGSVIFVRAHAEHKFRVITQDLKLLVFFSASKAS